ncbi:MAG: hypothetical protein WCK29_02045 [archaeon]
MGFGKIFSSAWNEFGSNFKAIFSLVFLVFVIKLIISHFMVPYSDEIRNSVFTFNNISMVLLALIIFIILSVFINSAIYGMSINKVKYGFRDLLKSARQSFWKFLGRSILLMLIMVLLFILLVVPGIIFMIYWIFAMFIWFNEPKVGFMNSLRSSKKLVEGRWWLTLGYTLLIFLIVFVIQAIFAYVPYLNSLVSLLSGVFLIYFMRYMYISYSSRTSNKKK